MIHSRKESLTLPLDKPGRILVVDDEKDVPVLFTQMFRREIKQGLFKFAFVSHGIEALELLEKDPHFEVVLSDIRMPNMDGLVLLANLNARYPLIKTVMVTAYGDMENIRRAMNSGAFDFVSKPIQYRDLKVTILKTLDHVRELKALHQAKIDKDRSQARLVSELRKLNKLKDDFLANTSHELKTPLNGMIGLIESLIEETEPSLPQETVKFLGLALSSGKRLSYLINDILDYSKVKNEELYLFRKPIDLANIVAIVLTFSKTLIGERPLQLSDDLPEDLPLVHADEDRLEQILFNLVGNAVKYTEAGEVRVRALLEDNRIVVEVSDTGPGISQQDLDRIFDSYQRGEIIKQQDSSGSGLGLSITKKLIELHGSHLMVESELGKGTKFRFSLDPVPEADAEIQVAQRQAPKNILADANTLDDKKPANHKNPQRILVVDDDPVNIQVLKRQLSDYQVRVAENGAKALSIIDQEAPFDLVVLDIMMPVISGYKLCKILRKRFKAVELPILLLTARNQVSDLVEGLEAGANDFLTKPLSRRELLARVKTHLELVTVHRQLKTAQEQALVHAREAGKAEFATTILHNVGNVLNSINISCAGIAERISKSRVDGLLKANELLKSNLADLPNFLANDSRGKKLPEYYLKLGDVLLKENETLRYEVARVQRRIVMMREIIETQQFFAKPNEHSLMVDLGIITDESLAVQAELLQKFGVTVHKKYALEDTVKVQQPLLVHVLVNLIKNAIEAMQTSKQRILTLETGRHEDQQAFCRISDTGEGMEDISQIFQSGFTTKKNGHGYGLFFCRKAVDAMGGRLDAFSDGHQKGSVFTVTFGNSEAAADKEESAPSA